MTLKKRTEAKKFDNQRRIQILYRTEDHEMLIRSSLIDDHHDITLFMNIDTTSSTVTEVEAYTNEIPFPDCAGVKQELEGLKGLIIGPGVKREYFKRIPRKSGCVHFTEIFIATVDFIWARLVGPELRGKTNQEKIKIKSRNADALIKSDSCRIFNQDQSEHFDEERNYKGKGYHY